jgi:transcription-repair coupling factor (superfamily II helicase)
MASPITIWEISTPMNITRLLDLAGEIPAYRKMTAELEKSGKSEIRALTTDASKPFLLAALYSDLQVPMVIVTAQPDNTRKLFEQISLWYDLSDIKLFPEPDALPYQRATSDLSSEHERLDVLYTLSQGDRYIPLVITSAPALMQKTISRDEFIGSYHIIEQGMNIEPLKLLSRWEALGYSVETAVDVPGTMSRRGGIIDIFPPTSSQPVRLEFFGNNIESIRLFDSASQRSQKSVPKVAICPATEFLPPADKSRLASALEVLAFSQCNPDAKEQIEKEIAILQSGQRTANMSFYAPLFNRGNLLEYLPPDTILVLDEPAQIKEETEYVDTRAMEIQAEKLENGELPANYPRPYFNWGEIQEKLAGRRILDFSSWASPGESQIRLNFAAVPSYAGQLPAFISKARELLQEEKRIIIISNQSSRLSELFEEEDILVQPVAEVQQLPGSGSITLVQGSMAEGWTLERNIYLFTDTEMFGFTKERRLLKKRPAPHRKLLVDLAKEDYVVHIEHGIGKFTGVITMDTDSTKKEYLALEYAAGDKLYVPTDQIDRVSRYVGSGDQPPALSRLGTQEWNRAKQKVKEDVEEIAQDLLQLYATREVVPGYAFSPDTVWQRELEASFPYTETPDQIKVQEEVKEDMSRSKPMDRLVCGDVGYGKTEIAIRAAFKAVMDNKQVAILVPTTVLAEQHFNTFTQRMVSFPIKIEVLSRFRSPSEQQAVIAGLANGSIDICIGTHRLLQKDVAFKDLGLLVIDEEQRFGVAHKEHLKKMREQVDVLTLTATPIPRTLHMSLVGVRDMSVIETPPEDRLPIQTYVAEYSDTLVRDAILRELERNGQVFFVHNRVQGIHYIAEKVRELVPEAKIAVAHGQMGEESLEKVMADFQRGVSNVLVCTTIIESGLDMPRVNTLIINRADRFGLTQLYQLRGRVGRGGNLAYAYFLYDKGHKLTETAEKRLRTIYEATELGAGFGIAMKDLEIRGAGTLLGMRQSGSISAVGFNLYCQMLAQAVERQKTILKGAEKPARPVRQPPTIDLPLRSYVPEEYVSDIDTRLSLYQKLTEITTVEQAEDLGKELTDRFGPLPVEVQNLLYAVRVKALAALAGVESISQGDGIITIRLFPGTRLDQQKVNFLLRYGIKIGITQLIINIKRLGKDWQRVVEEALKKIG